MICLKLTVVSGGTVVHSHQRSSQTQRSLFCLFYNSVNKERGAKQARWILSFVLGSVNFIFFPALFQELLSMMESATEPSWILTDEAKLDLLKDIYWGTQAIKRIISLACICSNRFVACVDFIHSFPSFSELFEVYSGDFQKAKKAIGQKRSIQLAHIIYLVLTGPKQENEACLFSCMMPCGLHSCLVTSDLTPTPHHWLCLLLCIPHINHSPRGWLCFFPTVLIRVLQHWALLKINKRRRGEANNIHFSWNSWLLFPTSGHPGVEHLALSPTAHLFPQLANPHSAVFVTEDGLQKGSSSLWFYYCKEHSKCFTCWLNAVYS